MPSINNILGSGVFALIWKRVFQRLNDAKIMQLITLKPIEVYNDTMSHTIDGAHMDIDIIAHAENAIQKPLKHAFNLFSLDSKQKKYNFLSYEINVDIDVKMDYLNIGKYLNHHFAEKQYWILNDQIGLYFNEFKLSKKYNQLQVDIPMKLEAKYKNLEYYGDAEVFARGNVVYNPYTKKVKITNISYVATSEKWILRIVNLVYYESIVKAMEDFLQFDIQDELDDGLKMLQEEVKEFDDELAFISGDAKTLDLNWIQLHPDGASARFSVKGIVRLLH